MPHLPIVRNFKENMFLSRHLSLHASSRGARHDGGGRNGGLRLRPRSRAGDAGSRGGAARSTPTTSDRPVARQGATERVANRVAAPCAAQPGQRRPSCCLSVPATDAAPPRTARSVVGCPVSHRRQGTCMKQHRQSSERSAAVRHLCGPTSMMSFRDRLAATARSAPGGTERPPPPRHAGGAANARHRQS